MTNKVIFIDVDGPLIPLRAIYLPTQTKIMSVFDPCATSMLLKLLDDSGAKLVISSSWGHQGSKVCADLFTKNGIDADKYFHFDWRTPRKMSSSRTQEIKWWLDDHPEVTHYVAIDDEGLDYDWLPTAVLCDAAEGFSWRNYLECCSCLETKDQDQKDIITYYKKREIWRTKRKGEPGQHLTWQAADQIFPKEPPNQDPE